MVGKQQVILSFDYELFFGDRSGTVQKTLIEPTNIILDAMDSVGFKGNFFVDWQMLKYLKEEGTERTNIDYDLIEKQLLDIVRRGHRIELHIHPHWVDAKYNGDGTWDFSDFTHYSLNSFTIDEIVVIFREGYNLLTSIARKVDPSYTLCAFRAGGWAVQPFDKVKHGLDAVGIKLDSSVMPGFKITCQHSKCDFLDSIENKFGFFHYSDNVCREDCAGHYIEVPITTIIPGFFYKLVRKVSKLLGMNFNSLADGTHVRSKDKPDLWEVPEGRSIATFSSCNPICAAIIPFYSNSDVVCFIDHPKDVSKYTAAGITLLGHFFSESLLYRDIISK